MKTNLEIELSKILYRYYDDSDYVTPKAVGDILKLLPKTHLVHKCGDEITELKARNSQLRDALSEFENYVSHKHTSLCTKLMMKKVREALR